ncbi:PTS fructose transporter subunit IIABC [Culicoidibacter larvae]|uniref:PTS fructose transporter subunit IIC n=1 Tax=Culicoidibacter larvae TaxID=2579976 RepID=A0A5R8Q729_9FIRM|nr:fructose-specific PTS transporter subunit EIIC [Culicoidibacter larvae]TLG71232.1 PTS fructose transporter subunit IIC [Culicoidibacter larvae]
MNIQEVLRKELVILDLQATTKEGAIEEMADRLVATGVVSDKAAFLANIWKREEEGTTGIGDGIAIPHAKTDVVSTPSIVFARSTAGVDFASMDGKPAYLFFMIATPANSSDAHLKLLSELSTQLIHESVRKQLMTETDYDKIIGIFSQGAKTENTVSNEAPFVVAVTGCATGIAHTYMAAEKLQEAGNKLGIRVKVETNGSTGVENRLTGADIKDAAGVVIAADVNVEMDRFDGKHLISQPVAAGIHKPEQLLQEAISGKAPVYHSEGGNTESSASGDKLSVGQQIYKHLMSGVSHMLPFVIGGGIAIALAFLLDQLIGVPQDQLASLGSYNAIASLFKQIGGLAFGFMLPVFAGYIAYSIADRPGLVAGFVAGGIAAGGGAIVVSLGEAIGITGLSDASAGFLGALVGGFLAGYVVLGIKALFKNLPKVFDGIKTILIYPVLTVIIVGILMVVITIPMGWLNTWLNDFLNGLSGANAILLGLLLGAMMAVDLGGPVNKAAYIFATGTLAATVSTGGSAIMAAVMAAGMVPPLATFVATLVFRKKFTSQERDAGLTNSVLGLSFITEGAIPFAAADPLRMIPSFIAGSAITGAIVMFLNIKVLAPHGGIFVIMLVSNPLFYIVAIVVGTLISALLIGVLRKKPTV